ncbi:MAG: CHAD domain-containing protein [Rubrobacteraceae bacterium]|nr:CHAD domain-containing protein [Rubrobacter sp.]
MAIHTQQRTASDGQEIEWQFEADDPDRVEEWLKVHASETVSVIAGETRRLSDTYFDTEDWRLYRAGYVLRVRRRGKRAEATMKSLAPAEDGLRRRREVTEPLGDGEPGTLEGGEGPVGGLLKTLRGARELRPLFENRTRRRTFEIQPRDAEAPDAGEVALDDCEIRPEAGAEAISLRRVEVEVPEESEAVRGFVEALRRDLGLHPASRSKFETGLRASGLEPAPEPDFGTTEFDASSTAGEVAFAVLRRNFVIMLACEPGVRLGEDPEELHDMRVATRRLRNALRIYADALPRRTERYERDLKHTADALGEVRDLDVHIAMFGDDPEDGDSRDVVNILERLRTGARERMLEVLDSKRYERLVADFSGMLRLGRSPSPPASILTVAPDLVQKRYEKARKAAKKIDEFSSPEDYHRLRKRARRLRYSLEPLAGIYGEPAEKAIKRLKKLQDALGLHQDAIVAAELLRELGTAEDLAPRVVFEMGVRAGRNVREAEEIQAGLPEAGPFRSLKKRKKWEGLWETMEARASEDGG